MRTTTPTRVFQNIDTNIPSPMQESPSLMFQMDSVESNNNGNSSKSKRNSRKWKNQSHSSKNGGKSIEQENQPQAANRQLFNFSTIKLSTPELYQQQTPTTTTSISLSLMTFGGSKLFWKIIIAFVFWK